MDYDASGNLAWSAAALSSGFGGTSACNHSFVSAAEKSVRSYDARNRLTYIDHPPGTADVSYSYYADGAPWTVASSDGGTWTYSYNKRRLLTGESLNIDGLTLGLTRHYDQHGHPASLVYPDGAAINYWPNALGQPTRVANYATAISYHPNGAVAGFNLGNGGLHSQTLNARQLPLRRRETRGGHSYLDHNYTYDRNGNVSGLLDNRPGGIESRYMEYDPVDRLTEATAPEMLGAEYFTYDPLDNLRSLTYPGRANLTISYGYNSLNRLSQIHLADNNGNTLAHNYGYDTRGNMLSGLSPGHVSRSHGFDKANRMLWASTNGQTEMFKYDGHGRRTKIQRNGSNVYQVYTRDGRFVLERAPNGTFTRHIHLGNRLLVSVTGSTPTYQHTDHLGSIVRKSDAAGNETQTTSYAPYGSIQNGTLTQGPGFTGHVSDQASGLSYMQQRYHDPLAMRFISVDPVLPSSSDGGNFNRYWYANNNPYKFVDPDGRFPGSREFEWENRQLGVTAPPRHPDDWLGPAIGVGLSAMLMAIPDPSDIAAAAVASRGIIFSMRGGTRGALDRLSRQAISTETKSTRNINHMMSGGEAGWRRAQKELGKLDGGLTRPGRNGGTVVKGTTRDGAHVEIRDFSKGTNGGYFTIKVTETGSHIQRMYRFEKSK